jgi:F0F1-type ATP synthase assembly protein I
MSNQTPQRENKPNHVKWLGFGVEFCGVIAIFCYIGYKIDIALNTTPYLLLAGFLISFIGMLYLVFKQTIDTRRK